METQNTEKKHSFDYLGHVLEFPISDELQ